MFHKNPVCQASKGLLYNDAGNSIFAWARETPSPLIRARKHYAAGHRGPGQGAAGGEEDGGQEGWSTPEPGEVQGG